LTPDDPRDGIGVAARACAHDLGPARLVDCAAAPTIGRRDRREIARTEGDWVVATIHVRGRSRFVQGDCAVEPAAGSVLVWHSTRPAEFAISQTLVKRSVYLPRDLLAGVCRQLDPRSAIVLAPDDPAVALFRAVAADVARCAHALDTSARTASARVLADLLATCLQPHRLPGRAALQTGLFALACDHIERRISDPQLRPTTVAEELRVPLRTLQDVFTQRGETIWAHIRTLRLERSYTELQRGADRTVMEIAFANGFTNAAHFTRCFREHFGLPPRDVQAAARAAVAA
jgi:AraC-like DNA-binding protein